MALVPVVNDMVPVTGGVSAEVERSEMALPARDRVSAAFETNMVPDSADPVQRVLAVMPISCWDKVSRPTVGLVDAEQVMHGGALDGPVLMNGLELSGIGPNEIVLRGGRLKKPSILTGLLVRKNKQFITLDKMMGGLCEYLTGRRPWVHPLKHIHVFQDMQKTMVMYCNQRMAESDEKFKQALLQEHESEIPMNRLVGKIKQQFKLSSGQRKHTKRSLAALPTQGPVDMSAGGIQWHPVCLLRPGTKNVAMEATTEHFAKLFEIVNQHMGANAALLNAGVHTPGRKIRRRPSHAHAPRGPPEARELYIKTKGWCRKEMKDAPTPGSAGSGSSHKCSKNR